MAVYAPNWVRCAVVGDVDSQEVVNTLSFFVPVAAPDLLTVSTIANAVMEWVENEMLPALSSEYTVLRVEGRAMNGPNGAVFNATPIGTGAGAIAGTALANNESVAISFRSGQAGRSYRGRNYWPLLVGGQKATSNEVSTLFVAAALGIYVALNGIVRNYIADAFHVVASTVANGNPRVTALLTQVASYIVTDLTVDSMRNRLPNRGI